MQSDQLNMQGLMRSPTLVIAFGFGAGLTPIVPGTVGTLVALPLWWVISSFNLVGYLAVVAGAFLLGVWVCDRASVTLGVHDHSGIVFDEIVGYLLALVVVPATLWGVVFSFLVFRILDVLKPWPINWLDRNIEGGLGVMLDDLVAGFLTGLIVIVAGLFDVV